MPSPRAGAHLRRAAGLVALLLTVLREPGPALADQLAAAAPTPGGLCLAAVAAAERGGGLPAHLLRSIAFVESGRLDPATGRHVPWPWAINAGGVGTYYESRDEAIAAVQRLRASGVRSIDVGCAQISLLHHPTAFASLEDAFDPRVNAEYAARFLNTLHRETGSWPLAAAGYHSLTPGIGSVYARRVLAIWPGAAQYGGLPALPASPAAAAPRPRTRPTTADDGIYTPAFAATSRRIDEDRARNLQAGAAPAVASGGRSPRPISLAAAGRGAPMVR